MKIEKIFSSPDYLKALENAGALAKSKAISAELTDRVMKVAGNYDARIAQKFISVMGSITDPKILAEIAQSSAALDALELISRKKIAHRNVAKVLNNPFAFNKTYSRLDFLEDIKGWIILSPQISDQGFSKYFRKIGDLTDVAKRETIQLASSSILRKNLKKAGKTAAPGDAAHHIVSGLAGGAEGDLCRKILLDVKLDLNDAVNGVFLDTEIHKHIHTKTYYENLYLRLAPFARNINEIKKELTLIVNEILQNNFQY